MNHIGPDGQTSKKVAEKNGPSVTLAAIRKRNPAKVKAANEKRAAQRKKERRRKKAMHMEKIPKSSLFTSTAEAVNEADGTERRDYVIPAEIKIVETVNICHEKTAPENEENIDFNLQVYRDARGELRPAKPSAVRGGAEGSSKDDAYPETLCKIASALSLE